MLYQSVIQKRRMIFFGFRKLRCAKVKRSGRFLEMAAFFLSCGAGTTPSSCLVISRNHSGIRLFGNSTWYYSNEGTSRGSSLLRSGISKFRPRPLRRTSTKPSFDLFFTRFKMTDLSSRTVTSKSSPGSRLSCLRTAAGMTTWPF